MSTYSRQERGYATLTAIVLCAAVSILCAGTLILVDSHKKIEARKFEALQREEALNTAVMQFAADLAVSEEPFEFRDTKEVSVGARRYGVKLVGQAEYAKWPLEKADEVSEKGLSKATRLSRQEVLALIASGRRNDCVASLFSSLGQIDPEKERPTKAGILYSSGSKDGQVWRIRAVSGVRLEERRVRFLGDPRRLFAVVSIDRMSLGEMPECADLITKP